ncbi:DUF2971 domain-containing protein [Pseudomonas syringae]|uniref:DUF2971 domain-containing protein n=1 Tax=Pseudomonas syringae TaxID=317 RepID=UPI000EFB7E71|nr:DUF2971 domain-containing protein [Pseudomonas syringae]MBI6672553.1 DUF2971 domain-containing protein [Pseudomonas syringae]
MSIEENIHAVVWGDVETKGDSHNRPPLLSHYTSVAVLEGMMANDEIWFSHPLYMNDSEELRFGMIEGANAFRNSAELKAAFTDDQLYNDLLTHFNNMFSEFDLNHVFDTYIMCLAKHDSEDRDGLLSMWRGYGAGGSGVAIVFDTSKISANEESPFIIDAVQYMTTEERLDWIFGKIKGMALALNDTTPTDRDLFCTAYYWIERLKIFSLFTKHKGFHEEKEWRIVYMNERDKEGRLKDMLGYAITPRGVEPKLKFKVKPLEGMFGAHLSLEGVIDRIILGPTTSTVMAANSVKRLLQQKGKLILAEKIVPSTIPFRL